MNFLDRVDYLMEKKGINKNQLATLAGLPVSTIYGWYKKGYDSITLPTIRKLCDFFGCTMEWLVNGEDVKKELSSDALDLAQKYDAIADEHSRGLIRTVVEYEYEHHDRPSALPTSEWLFAHAITSPDAEGQSRSG